jgi:hypothetical protein
MLFLDTITTIDIGFYSISYTTKICFSIFWKILMRKFEILTHSHLVILLITYIHNRFSGDLGPPENSLKKWIPHGTLTSIQIFVIFMLQFLTRNNNFLEKSWWPQFFLSRWLVFGHYSVNIFSKLRSSGRFSTHWGNNFKNTDKHLFVIILLFWRQNIFVSPWKNRAVIFKAQISPNILSSWQNSIFNHKIQMFSNSYISCCWFIRIFVQFYRQKWFLVMFGRYCVSSVHFFEASL